MRDQFTLLLNDAESEALLTTGEAALLLGTSRQHVVNLCNEGSLSCVTVGRHRRVVRRDVEALRTATSRLTRDQLKSLWLGHAVAARLVEDPFGVMAQARDNLERLRRNAARGSAKLWLDEWAKLLDGSIEEVLAVLTSRSPRSRELRQNTPFAGALSAEERQAALRGFAAAHPHESAH
ncbi:MAG: helix-turn-helix domain-containing protein [Myxococcaceae bacterium]